MSAILEKLIALRNEIDGRNRKALLSISTEYARVMFRLEGDIESLMLDLQKDLTPRQISQLPSYQRLVVRLEEEISGYSFWLKGQLEDQSQENVLFGSFSAKIFLGIAFAMGFGIAPDLQQEIGEFLGTDENYNTADPAIVNQLLSQYMNPLLTKVGQMSTFTIGAITNAINGGASAQRISSLLGLPLADAVRFMRTIQGWSYREALRADYVANGIGSWVWISQLDTATCLSCVAQHGNIYPVSESLNDHPSGWCTPLPVVDGVDYGLQSGQDWWNDQPDDIKRQMAGDLKFNSMLDGTTLLGDYSVEVENDIYGKIRIESSQKNLVGG